MNDEFSYLLPETDVFILAAGFGKRLRPLTTNCPKPLVQIAGKSLIEWNLELLASAGFQRFIINSHYLADRMEEHFNQERFKSSNITLVHEPEILGTGGGIKNIRSLVNSENFLTFNSDIVIDRTFNPADLLKQHLSDAKKPVVTMVLRDSADAKSFGLLGVDKQGAVVELLGDKFNQKEVVSRLMYTGIQVLSQKVFDYMPATKVFGMTEEVYPAVLNSGELIGSVVYDGYWNDAGTPERLKEGENFLNQAF